MGKPVPVTLFHAYFGGQNIDSFEAKGKRGAEAYIKRRYSSSEKVVICPGGVSRNPRKFRRKRSEARFPAASSIRHGFTYTLYP